MVCNKKLQKTKKSENPEAQWFGFEKVNIQEKSPKVNAVFNSVFLSYDLMNDLMSFGLHRLWKNRLVALMRPRRGQKILDIACGTGDITLRCAVHTEGNANLSAVDLNFNMLREGKMKAANKGVFHGINWLVGNAEFLPFKKESFDLACIAFGLRNVAKIDTTLKEIFRVLKPGGRFFCIEFSPGFAPWLKNLYDSYSFKFIPKLGEIITGDQQAYKYLAESIRKFPNQHSLAKRMKRAGFSQISWVDLMYGIVAIHIGNKKTT